MTTTQLSVHANDGGLKVSNETPSNSGVLTLVAPDGTSLILYLPLEQWWLLRQLPKADGYYFCDGERPYRFERDHATANEMAKQFFQDCTWDVPAPEADVNDPNNFASLGDEAQRMVGAARE